MNHFILSLVLASLFIGDPFSLFGLSNNLWAESTNRFGLQVASCDTLNAAQKEMARLQAFGLEARYTTRVDRFNKKWFIVYFNNFETKEKATRYGNELINEGVIKNFQIFSKKEKDEFPAKVKESPPSPPISSLKESKPTPEKSPGKEGDEFLVKESSPPPPPPTSIPFGLQVASLSTETDAQKEIDRLKLFSIQAHYITMEDQANRKWYVVFIDAFKTKEEATQYGNQLINKNIIKNFRVFPKKAKKEVSTKTKEYPLSAPTPSLKESKPIPEKSPRKEKDEFLVKESSPPLPPPASIPFVLQVATLSTETDAQKEIDRLKLFSIQAHYIIKEDQANRKWYVVFIDAFKTKEEAIQYGNQLINKNIIKNFRVLPQKAKEEISTKTKESPPSAPIPTLKESKPVPEKSTLSFGPIVIKEEETSLRINIFLEQKIFPEIMTDKITDGSRLMLTFKNIGKNIIPVEFDKIHSKIILAISLANKGPDCIFTLLLNSAYNYEVSQNYYEKENLYSLFIGSEAVAGPNRTIKE